MRPTRQITSEATVGTLLLLSGILMATTLFPHLNVIAVTGYLTVALVSFAAVAGLTLRWTARRHPTPHATMNYPRFCSDPYRRIGSYAPSVFAGIPAACVAVVGHRDGSLGSI